ncbi:MAG: hypothetical protein GY811_01345 [Myxococcales bacterium]|nr:hypothetical protein [Myxococcales bacterium]
MANRLLAADIHCPKPTSGSYLLPDLGAHAESFAKRGIYGSTQLCAQLLEETGVAVLPGCDFGRPEEEFTLRAAYVDFDGRAAPKAAAESSEPLGGDFVRSHCGNVHSAIEALCDWAIA